MQYIEHIPFIPDWVVIYFIIVLSLFAWIRITSGNHFASLLQATFSVNTANRLYRETITNFENPSIRFNILFYITTGVFLLHLQKIHYQQLQFPDHIMATINILSVFIFFNLKYFLYRISGFIYNSPSLINEFLFYSKTSNQNFGIFLLPLSIIMFFTQGFLLHFLSIMGLLIFLFISIINAFRGFQINTGKDISIYYLILYLCTLEILPLVILWKIFR